MDTKLKTNIKTFLYRIIAVGALFTMIFSGIMGREAFVNLYRMGAKALSGNILYLTDYREYMATLALQALIGYSGVGDDNGYPLSEPGSSDLSKEYLDSFRKTAKYGIKDDLIYYVDRDNSTLDKNISYPLFSDYDGHLIVPDDARLCLYWDGPNNALHFFNDSHDLNYPAKQFFNLYTDLQYRPNQEKASQIRLFLAVRNTDMYTNKELQQLDILAKNYQQVLLVFFSSMILFLATGILSLLTHKSATYMWQTYAAYSLKPWLECKLILIALLLYACYLCNLWAVNFSWVSRAYAIHSLWLYFPTGILLFLFYKDISLNKIEVLKHSMIGSILCLIKEYFAGIKWYRKALNLTTIVAVSGVVIIIAGNSCLLIIMGIILLMNALRLRHFMRDVNTIAGKLSKLREGASEAPVSLPAKSLLREAASDLNALENGIEIAVEQQNRSNRMRVELITNVSHDLKTPLTSIINYADLLCEEKLPDPAAEYASALQAKAYRLKGMVQDVFDLSKATSGNMPVEKTVLDLVKLLKQTLADMDERITDSTLTFKLNIATEPLMIEADGEKLYRVFQNLIVNALQYSLENSRVHIQLTAENGYAYARVKNTSRLELDFDPEEIVERFVRADSSRTTEGSGLGLSIVQSFTEACGGRFHITTDADMFTACVCFPLSETTPAASVCSSDEATAEEPVHT